MLKKISLGILKPRRDESESTKERARAASMPRPSSPLDFSDGEPDVFARLDPQQLRIEALNLEPLIEPYLRQIRPLVAPREMLMGQGSRPQSRSPGEHLRDALSRRPSSSTIEAAQNEDIALLRYAVPLNTPDTERGNPFDDPEQNELLITQLPTRPSLPRRPISARGRRDMPLRVQAMRRSHQHAFARAVQERIEEEAAAWSRRTSEEEENETLSFTPSNLLARRQGSPIEEVGASLRRVNIHAEDDPNGMFRQRMPDGAMRPYRIGGETPMQSLQVEEERQGLYSQSRGAATPPVIYTRSDGHTFF